MGIQQNQLKQINVVIWQGEREGGRFAKIHHTIHWGVWDKDGKEVYRISFFEDPKDTNDTNSRKFFYGYRFTTSS